MLPKSPVVVQFLVDLPHSCYIGEAQCYQLSLITLLTKLFLFLLAAGFLCGAVLAPTLPRGTPVSYFPRVSMCVALKQQHEYVKIHRAVDLAKIFSTRMTI